MKAITLASLAAVAGLMLAPMAASAAPVYQDHAIDKSGNPIVDARGNCVYTKWDAAGSTCGAIGREARTVYFDFNKATVKASEKAKLNALIAQIKGNKQIVDVDVIGYADRIGGAGSYNTTLSRRRAEAVKAYLLRNGVKTRKIDLQALGVANSVTQCDPKLPRKELISCLAKDRRVEVNLNFAK